MRVVVGIDAAWTLAQPSGVALAVGESNDWRLLAVADSYERFCAQAEPEGGIRRTGSRLDVARLLAKCQEICGAPVDLVAVDMPLSTQKIVGRRTSDNAVSAAYGARKCSTHTPNVDRPGRISALLREDFETAGYRLQTTEASAPALIEVYPHPALVELANATERLPYKVSRIRAYWPLATPVERRAQLLSQWGAIVSLLDERIAGVKAALPIPAPDASTSRLKAFEDMLDAAICAFVATCVLDGRARPFGDQDSAIWIPKLEPERNAVAENPTG